MMSPTKWKIGPNEVDVTVSPKPILLKALAPHWASILKRKAASILGVREDFCTKGFQKLYAKYDATKRRMPVQLVAGQVYTTAKAAKIGVEILGSCQLCRRTPSSTG